MSDFEKLLQVTKLLQTNEESFEDVTRKCEKLLKDFVEKFNQEPNKNSFSDLFYGTDFNFGSENDSKINLRNPTVKEKELLNDQCKNSPDLHSMKLALGLYPGVGDTRVKRKPCIAAMGLTNSGKSFLINTILGRRRIALSSETRLTSRMTYFTYSSSKFVSKLRVENSEVIDLSIDRDLKKDDFIDRKKMDLHEIRVGNDIDILKYGLDMVDSPGLNENINFNNTCDRMLKLRPSLLLYVIDGRMGLLESDTEYIAKLKYTYPELPILYFVTKLDQSQSDKELNGQEDEVIVAERRLKKVFNRLQEAGFISSRDDINVSKVFHGASLWIVDSIQNDKQQSSTDSKIYDFHRKRFSWFQHCLSRIIEAPLREKTEKMRTTLETIIELSRISACDIVEEVEKEKEEKLKMTSHYLETEGQLYRSEVTLMTNEFKKKILEVIQENKDRGVDESIINDILNEYVKNKEEISEEFVNTCRIRIQEAIDKRMMDDIKKVAIDYTAEKEIDLRQKLRDTANNLQRGRIEWPSFNTMLTNRLVYEYQLSECNADSLPKATLNFGRLSGMLNRVSSLLKACFGIDRPENSPAGVKVWLENQYKSFLLNSLKNEDEISKASQLIYEEFETRHNKFVTEIDRFAEYLRKNRNVGQQDRLMLQEVSHQFATQYVRVLDIITSFDIPVPSTVDKEQIGQGSQALVNKFQVPSLKFGEKPKFIVEKHYHKNSFQLNSPPGQLAMEIFYCSRLSGPTQPEKSKFLTMLGLRLTPSISYNLFTLCVYFEYLELGDCQSFLKKNIGNISKAERLKLALDIAKGLGGLHSLKITHRDIKLENILIRRRNGNEYEAVIADYGFSKSIGFLNNTKDIGTPLYMAPELFGSGSVDVEKPFNEKIDVYSYGILLWMLMSYCFDKNPENCDEYPRFVQEDRSYLTVEGFEKAVLNAGKRPELRKVIDESVFALMEDCWNRESDRRPSFNDENGGIIKRLNELFSQIQL